MRQFLALLLALSVLLVACGGGSDDGPVPTDTPSTPDGNGSNGSATSIPTTPQGPAVGQVDNADGDARVNGKRANQDLALRAGDQIATGEASSIDFTLTAAPRVECKTLSRSELQVRPDGATQLRWTSQGGVSYCNVERGQPPVDAVFGIDPDIEIAVEGTLFGVVDNGTLRVVEGFVLVTRGGTTQRLGPNQEVVLASADQPGARQPWQGLPADDQALVSDLQANRTPPSPLPTDSEFRQSPLLSAMQRQGAIVVLLDDNASPDDGEFVRSYFERLAASWLRSGDVDMQRVRPAEAAVLLQQAPNAVYVSTTAPSTPPSAPPPAAPTATASSTGTATASSTPVNTPDQSPRLDLASSPFYIDRNGDAWSIWFQADSAAVVAFGRFTRASLSTGDYFDMYFPFFDAAPPYDALLALGP